MSDLTQFRAGESIRVTINQLPSSAPRATTLREVLSQGEEHQNAIAKNHGTWKRQQYVKIHTGRKGKQAHVWTPKVGAQATLRLNTRLLEKLKSVQQFLQVQSA